MATLPLSARPEATVRWIAPDHTDLHPDIGFSTRFREVPDVG